MECAILLRPSWDEIHFTSAVLWAQRSRDPSSQVGCAIVSADNVPISYGYNGPPRDVEFSDEDIKGMERDEKLLYFEHGERNAIFNAVRSGATVRGATLYIIGTPCCDCCRAIIQTGIKCVKVLKSTGDIWAARGSWAKSMAATTKMLKDSGVRLEVVDAKILGNFDILIGGVTYIMKGNQAILPEKYYESVLFDEYVTPFSVSEGFKQPKPLEVG